MIIVKESTIHGKGAFAQKNIKKGTILKCDVLEVKRDELIKEYLFTFKEKRVCIHVGFASFLNSSFNPNVKHLKVDPTNKISYFKVIKDIKENEELTMKYSINK